MAKKISSANISSPTSLQDTLLRYQALLPEAEYSTLAACAVTTASPALRVNTLKCEVAALDQQLTSKYGWQFEPIPFCPSGLRPGVESPKLSGTIEHRLGWYYIQDAASMLPPELFDFTGEPRTLILDMAASPGGKTTHLASLTADHGLIIANDASRSRLQSLRVVLQNWGALNQAITSYPGEQMGFQFPGVFDAVLLDAPCSMEGLRASASHANRSISEGEREQLAQRQARLLEGALRAVKVGGQVVYSTCSLAPEEDEAVLDDVLTHLPGCFEILPIPISLTRAASGLTMFGERHYATQVQYAARLWPHNYDTAGFFAALLRKITPLPGESRTLASNRRIPSQALVPVSARQAKVIHTALVDSFELDLFSVMQEYQCALYQRGAETWLIPERLGELPDMAWSSAGMMLGKPLPGGWLPSHEFAARFECLTQHGKVSLPAEFLPAWLEGRDAHGFTPANISSGAIVLVYDENGRYIGRGKALNGRLRNLLPARIF